MLGEEARGILGLVCRKVVGHDMNLFGPSCTPTKPSRAVQSLICRLLVNTEHGGMLRRIQIKVDNVGLLFKMRIVGRDVAFQLAWLQASLRWSCRKMAAELGLSKSTVQRVWVRGSTGGLPLRFFAADCLDGVDRDRRCPLSRTAASTVRWSALWSSENF
jgi:hypothetical protein